MNCIKISLSILFLSLCILLQAQAPYQPLEDDNDLLDKTLNTMNQRFQKDLASIKGPYKKELKSEYTKRFEGLSNKLKNGHFINNPELNDYFNSILNKIIAVNPSLQNRNLRLLISRYAWPNASCHGEGSIVLNLGLISRLENESQLAFVICHELSHDYFNHVNNAIHTHVKKLYGKETQKKLKKISKSEYRTNEKASKLLQSLVFDMRSHGRMHEVEADSMALVFMKPTQYDTREAVKCLAILDKVDVPKRANIIDFKKYFETDNFKIKDRWLQIDEGNNFVYNSTDESSEVQDSLKTHPDCQTRIKIAQKFAHNESSDSVSQTYNYFIRLADYEIIEGEYLFGNYGQALFKSFLMLEENPDDSYLHSTIMICLFELHQHQQSHKLANVLQLPDKRFEENYNNFLNFIHKLRLRDLAKLGHFYGIKNGESFSQNEDFRATHLCCTSLVQTAKEWNQSKRKFFADFPNSNYSKMIRSLNKIADDK